MYTYKKNSEFEENKEYLFKSFLCEFKSKVIKDPKTNYYYTTSDGVNKSDRGIYKATSILCKDV